MKHSPIEIDGLVYNFEHLQKTSMEVASEKAKKNLIVGISFTNHCYTVAHDPSCYPKEWPILHDGGGRTRAFCLERYGLSKQMLPSLVTQLNCPQAVVQQTVQRRNWVYSTALDTDAGRYNVFFELRRAAKNSGRDLEMIVESAYPRSEPAAVLGKMKFIMLCGKTFLGLPVATRR